MAAGPKGRLTIERPRHVSGFLRCGAYVAGTAQPGRASRGHRRPCDPSDPRV